MAYMVKLEDFIVKFGVLCGQRQVYFRGEQVLPTKNITEHSVRNCQILVCLEFSLSTCPFVSLCALVPCSSPLLACPSPCPKGKPGPCIFMLSALLFTLGSLLPGSLLHPLGCTHPSWCLLLADGQGCAHQSP